MSDASKSEAGGWKLAHPEAPPSLARGAVAPSIESMRRLALPAILAVASVLLLWHLDARLLWQDEANTAVIARNILRVGYPCGWDGRNFFPHESLRSIANPQHVITHQSWLQYYLLAVSFLLLGPTTFAARLPCALAGVATVGLTFLLARRLTGSRRQALLASILLVASVPFLLHGRQARYYAAAMFLTAAVMLAYLAAAGPAARRRHWAGFAIVGALLFHTHPLVFLAGMSGIGCHFLLFHRRGGAMRPFAVSIAAMALLTTPYLYPLLAYYAPAKVADSRESLLGRGLSFYLVDVNLALVPLPVLVLAAAPLIQAARRQRGRRGGDGAGGDPCLLATESLPWMIFGSTFFVAVALPLIRKPSFNFRYLIGLLPVASCMVAHLLGWLWGKSKAVAVVLGILTGGTNLLSMPAQPLLGGDENPDVPLFDYFQYLTVPFKGPDEGIVGFLQRWAKPDDWVTTSYAEMPILFYTGLRVAFRRSQNEAPPPPELLRGPDGPVRWVVARHGRQRDYDGVHRRIARGDDPRYEEIVLTVPDLRWGNVPEPGIHPFRAPRDEPRVTIFYYPSARFFRESPFPYPLLDYAAEAEVRRSPGGGSGGSWHLRSQASGRAVEERYLSVSSFTSEVVDRGGKVVLGATSAISGGEGGPAIQEAEGGGEPPGGFSLSLGLSYRYDLPFVRARGKRRGTRSKRISSPVPFEVRPGVDRYRFRVEEHGLAGGPGAGRFSFLVGAQEAGGRGRFWGRLTGNEWDGGFAEEAGALVDPYVVLDCPSSGVRRVLPLAAGPVGGGGAAGAGPVVQATSVEVPIHAGCVLGVGYAAFRGGPGHPGESGGAVEERAFALAE